MLLDCSMLLNRYVVLAAKSYGSAIAIQALFKVSAQRPPSEARKSQEAGV